MRIVRCVWMCLLLAAAAEAGAQPAEPIGPFAADVRGSLARFKEDAAVAATIGVETKNLPTRGLGLTVGAHFYPLRWRRVTLGVGGEMLIARDSRTLETDSTATVAAPTVTTRVSALSPQVSLNFGRRDGWSYVSGGIGRARLTAQRDDQAAVDASRTRSTNYGGGARWFTGPHLAFSVDLRFYAIDARAAAGAVPAFPRTRMMVISAGISLR